MNEVRLEVRAARQRDPSGDRLVIRYVVHNRSPSVVGLFARLAGLSPNEAYVHVDGGVLWISKGILTPPPGVSAAETALPYVMFVQPGTSFREELTFPIPVVSNHPMRALALEDTAPRPMEAVADRRTEVVGVGVSIDAFFRTAQVRTRPLGPSHPDVFALIPPFPAHESLSARTTLASPVTALDYRLVTPSWAR
ncbi:MAG TPA: hypothetical protein VIL20_11285 [Sandaracinaceae bacterium]